MSNKKINYPVTKVNSKNWIDHEDLLPLFDKYLYTSKEKIFNDYFHNKEYVDCEGNVFKIIGRIPPTNFWRKLFKFIPRVYKIELIFKNTDRNIELNELKEDLISGIKRFDSDETRKESKEWILEIKRAKSIRELLSEIK